MKLNKTILAIALGLSAAGLSQAETVYLTGSTAMRSTIYAELTNAGTVFTTQPIFTGYSGSTAAGSGPGDTYMGFAGTLVGGSGTTIINCFWSGSEDGILHVASNNVVNQTFMLDSLIATSGSGGDNTGSPTITNTAAALCMADNAQTFSRTVTPTLTGTEVGVITFEWVRNPGLWGGTNVTDSQILQALGGIGGAKRAVFDGTASHTNDYVYVSGRDTGSGTRVNAFGNSGFGIVNVPSQIEMNSSGVMQPLLIQTNRFGVVSTNYSGNFGFSSGGTLAGTMGSATSGQTDFVHTNASGGYSVIAYVGISDGNTAIGKGALPLAYNGVAFTTNNVLEGTYTFWGNEYIYEANNADSIANAAFGLIGTNADAFCDGTKAIALSQMHSQRGGPTSAPGHN
jgi:hypothetical protein